MGIYIILTSIIGGLAFSGVLFFIDKVLAKKHTGESSDELKTVVPQIESYDEAIVNARKHASSLEPLSNFLDVKEKEESLLKVLEEQLSIFNSLEKKLKDMQLKVETAEASHNSLKKEKEESVNLAADLKNRNVKLETDNQALQSELSQSLGQLNLLSSEIDLTPDQEAGFKRLKTSINTTNEQLKTLSGTYQRASNRFSSLFAQYSDLEKEFTKLVEKELGGNE